MNIKTNRLLASSALFLVGGSALLNATDEARMRNIENRVSSLENSKSGCCVINPSARPFAKDCWGFYVTVDPLIWQARVSGLGLYTVTNGGSNFISTTGLTQSASKVKNLGGEWDWGVRVGLGFNWDCDGWDTVVRWTWWKPDADRHTTADSTHVIFPNVGNPFTTMAENPGKASAKWNMHYNMLDLEQGREFYVSKCLVLRPFTGLRSLWIKQHLHVNYNLIPNVLRPEHTISEQDRFWGFGILGGWNTQWNFGCGWSIFSNYAGSLLYGFHSVKYAEYGTAGTVTSTLTDVHDLFHVVTAVLDAQLGIRYDWISCDECYHLGFDIGWENHWLPGQNQFLVYTTDMMEAKFIQNQGDIGIQGFFARVRFDF